MEVGTGVSIGKRQGVVGVCDVSSMLCFGILSDNKYLPPINRVPMKMIRIVV